MGYDLPASIGAAIGANRNNSRLFVLLVMEVSK